MSTTTTTPRPEAAEAAGAAPADTVADPREQVAMRIVGDVTGALEALSVWLGLELGLYAALAEAGSARRGEVAARAGVHERYADEWLEQQAAAGMLAVDDPALPADARRYSLGAAQQEVLLDPDSPFATVGATGMLAGVAGVLRQLPDAFRTGGGIPYSAYGRELRDGIAAFNRPMFRYDLAQVWLPAMPDVDARLRLPGGRILDLGCGAGASTVALAAAYPLAHVTGVDLDEASVRDARAAAAAAGVADQVTFLLGDAARLVEDEEPYDLVTVFEALHDMGDPVGGLRTARAATGPSGTLLVADERVGAAFTAPAGEIERFNYGWSVLHCLPATMAEQPVEANGTVLRAGTVRRWAAAAGWDEVTELDVDNPFWRFYRMTRR